MIRQLGPEKWKLTNSNLNLNFESCRPLLFKSNTNSTNYIYNFYSRFPKSQLGICQLDSAYALRIRSFVVISRIQYKILTN